MTFQLLMIVVAVFLIAVGIFFVLKVIGINRKKIASERWPVTTGHVLSKDVSSTKNSSSSGFTYRADVTYNYDAPGGPYERSCF